MDGVKYLFFSGREIEEKANEMKEKTETLRIYLKEKTIQANGKEVMGKRKSK